MATYDCSIRAKKIDGTNRRGAWKTTTRLRSQNYSISLILPIFFQQQHELIRWMAAYYMCSEGEVLNGLPSGLKLSSECIGQSESRIWIWEPIVRLWRKRWVSFGNCLRHDTLTHTDVSKFLGGSISMFCWNRLHPQAVFARGKSENGISPKVKVSGLKPEFWTRKNWGFVLQLLSKSQQEAFCF